LIGGNEYLIPIDGTGKGDPEMAALSFVEIRMVINWFSKRRLSSKVPLIFIFDCCRSEFGASAETQFLGDFGSTVNIFIMYSTARRSKASDGVRGSGNGAYTEYLLKHLENAGTIADLSMKVRNDLFNDHRYKKEQVRPEE
jgi:hypothetical protein